MNYTYIDIDAQFNNDEVLDFLKQSLNKFGLTLSNSSAINFSLPEIKNYISATQNDLIFIKLSKNYNKNTQLKKELCNCFNSFLVKNSACAFAIESFLRLHKGTFNSAENFEEESLLPDGAEPLTSDFGFVQGCMLRYKNINFIFLPPDVKQVDDIIENKLGAILYKLYKTPTEFLYFKLFGITQENLESVLKIFRNNSVGILINYSYIGLDCLLTIGYDNKTNKDDLNNFVSQICESLKKYLYATENVSLNQTVLDFLNLTKKKCAVLESLTYGKILYGLFDTDCIITNNQIEFHKVVNDTKKLDFLETINKNNIANNGMFLVDSVYDISSAILNETLVDIVVSSIATYNKNTSVANSFLAIGDRDGIHIYKNTYKGDFKDVQEMIVNNVYFYLIRKLKQNDLIFDQTLLKM